MTLQHSPIVQWIVDRERVLKETLRLDAIKALVLRRKKIREAVRAQQSTETIILRCSNAKCMRSMGDEPYFRCMSGCWACQEVCGTCLLEKHADQPLHRVEVLALLVVLCIWAHQNEQRALQGHWQKFSLALAGLRITLGHSDGTVCAQPKHHVKSFVVLHTNGIHEVNLQFCRCTAEFVDLPEQLLRHRWWPATTIKPKTAATFEVLDAFDAQSGTGKQNTYDFYNGLVVVSDGEGLHDIPVSQKYQ